MKVQHVSLISNVGKASQDLVFHMSFLILTTIQQGQHYFSEEDPEIQMGYCRWLRWESVH